MEYVYASLLLHTAGKEVNEENLKKVLNAAGVKADEVRVKMLVAALKEINIDEVLKQATLTPVTPIAPVTVQAAAPAPQQAQPTPTKTEEEEKKEVSEEEIAEGISSLFG
ncbi:MAG: 50S ribosomal protein P1 [Desulfurococcaceae archaeon TW002]